MPDLSHLDFQAPGPGLWMADGLHSPRPGTALGTTDRDAFDRGFRLGAERYGLMGDGVRGARVHRFNYGQPRFFLTVPPGNPTSARAHFDELVAGNFVLADRFRAAEETLETRRWESDRAHWDAVGKPALLARTAALTAVDPADLNDDGIFTHLNAVFYQISRAEEYHFYLNPVMGVPIGMYVHQARQWTGATAAEVTALLVGASPVTVGEEPELQTLVQAIGDDEAAAALLDGPADASDRLESLRSRDGAVGQAARVYVDLVGYRTAGGWDAMDFYALEEPSGILATIKRSLDGAWPALDPAKHAALRDRVPAEQQSEFDALLADAREYMPIRDERDVYCNLPVQGLVRRSVLEIGRRLKAAGAIDDVELATEADLTELRALLAGKASAGLVTELAERHDFRNTYTYNDIPPALGTPNAMPIPPDWLPPAAQKLAISEFAHMEAMFGARPGMPRPSAAAPAEEAVSSTDANTLTGIIASPGVYEGPARVVLGPRDFGNIQQGDVLIAATTNPAFGVVLAKLGAIVTDHGGALSHAAIVAREFGLPAIVGVGKATQTFVDGQRVRVEADSGEVRLIE
jgi:phosphohistidine swiveling domain-containing protein